MSRELPILFNTEMVRAILDGRKTCTRRIMKPQLTAHYGTQYAKPPYVPGDILYVRETWGTYSKNWWEADYFMYRADYPNGATTYTYSDGIVCDLPKWHPSIHMPKEAARIWLRVVDVQLERLQDISNDEAIAEGAQGIECNHVNADSCGCTDCMNTGWIEPPIVGFMQIWDGTIKKSELDLYGWEANPWVWVIEFERCDKEGRAVDGR